MVDWETIGLNVGGWLVAGLVTLAGVLVAHRLRQKSEQDHEDRMSYYEPLFQEMKGVVDHAESTKEYGSLLWSPSDTFNWIDTRGVLLARRFESISGPVEELKRAYKVHQASWSYLGASVRNAYTDTFDATGILSSELSNATVGDVLGHDLTDTALYVAIMSANIDKVSKRIDALLLAAGGRVGGNVQIAPPMNADSMALAILRATEKDRMTYLKGCDELMLKVVALYNLLFEYLRK